MARTKGALNKSTADVKALASKYTDAAMKELGRLSLNAESESARVAAIRELFDRAYGKATQKIAGDEGGAPIAFQQIVRKIVDPHD